LIRASSISGGDVTVVRRILRNRSAAVGICLVAFFAIVAATAPWLAPHDPNHNDLLLRLAAPSAQFPLGNDELGRDILSRIIWGARTSMYIALGAVGLALIVSIPLGLAAGYFGRWVDWIISGIIDVLMAFPGLLLALAIVATFGIGTEKLILAVGLYSVPTFARLVRATTIANRNQEYVQAAIALGQRDVAIMFNHVLPNITGPLIVEGTLRAATVVLTASTLSFLGLGVPEPYTEWGAMIASSSDYMRVAPHATIFPGVALMLLILGFSLAGDGMRDVLDPTRQNVMP
jgi:peptide/nickel transport system permease protein